MIISLPVLEDYDISPLTGFLPDEPPLLSLGDPYYDPWETIVKDLPALVLTRRLRDVVDAMPVLSTDKLITEAHWRRACSILGFLAHGYVWAGDKPSDHIPDQIAEPWLKVCDHFELPPIGSYAGLCLWNFKPLFQGGNPEEWTLENLSTLITYTGCIDESWFYLVSTVIERQGAPMLVSGLEAIQATRENNGEKVVKCLQILAEEIDKMNTTLGRLYEMCDPYIFFYRIRPFLAGWKNMEASGLPRGVRYGKEKEYRQYAGGSNAQSSLIQALDIMLSVEHHPTGLRPQTAVNTKDSEGYKPPSENNFLKEMRTYMPGKHRRFLEHLSQVAEIKDYVLQHPEIEGLTLSYDACLAMLRAFRDKHIQVVTRYVVMHARDSTRSAVNSVSKREGLAKASDGKSRGTGGTALIPFLKQARDETGDGAAGTWGRRLLSENKNILSKLTMRKDTRLRKERIASAFSSSSSSDEEINESDTPKVQGLSTSWTISEEEEGIPHW